MITLRFALRAEVKLLLCDHTAGDLLLLTILFAISIPIRSSLRSTSLSETVTTKIYVLLGFWLLHFRLRYVQAIMNLCSDRYAIIE